MQLKHATGGNEVIVGRALLSSPYVHPARHIHHIVAVEADFQL